MCACRCLPYHAARPRPCSNIQAITQRRSGWLNVNPTARPPGKVKCSAQEICSYCSFRNERPKPAVAELSVSHTLIMDALT